jgi:Tfp pilus assembly protein PilN
MADINLLPPRFKRIDALDARLTHVYLWLGIALFGLGMVIGTAWYSTYSLNQQSARLSQQITDKIAAAQFDELSGQVRSLASLAEEYQRVFARNRVWEELFTYLEQTIPGDTTVEAVTSTADKTGYLVTVTGTSADRRSIGLFRENLLSYKSQPSQPERVSQVVIESITADASTGRQQFSLKLSFDLNPKTESK